MSLHRTLAPLVDRPRVELGPVIDLLIDEDPGLLDFDLERLISIAERLPSGLMRAESIWAMTSAPTGLQPLAAGSAWYALDRTLMLVLPGGVRPLVDLVIALAEYALAARQIAERLGEAGALVAALTQGELSDPNTSSDPRIASLSTQLALHLDAAPELIESIKRKIPALLSDLGAMAAGAFSPEVRVHASARPARWKRRGESIARRLLAELPAGPFRVLVSDAFEPLDHLSPYPRDLGRALFEWARQNPAELSPGVIRAIERGDGGSEADVDLASVIAPDVLGPRPELVVERREAEKSTGLHLFDESGMVWGYADLSRLAADPIAIPRGSAGTLVAIAGGAPESIAGFTGALLDTGRVTALGLVLGSGAISAPATVPEALVTDDDGFRLELAGRLEQRAQELGIACARTGPIDLGDASDEPARIGALELATELLAMARRAEVLGRFPAAGSRVLLVLHPRPARVHDAAEARLYALRAGRLALSVLHDGEPGGKKTDIRPKLPNSVRFRV